MRFAFRILIGLSLLQGTAFAQSPEIQVVDGKVTMSALAVPLGQLLTLLDRATGLKSEVLKPELANRNISVRFTKLELNDAVAKIFEGQPLNYMMIAGKGIRVFDLAQGAPGTSSPTPSFQDAPVITNQPLQFGGAPVVQPTQPANIPVQQGNNPTGVQPAAANASPAGQAPTGPTPGQLPPSGQPAVGGINPLIPTVNTGGGTGAAAPVVGFPGASAPAPQPTGPGTIGGSVTPGTISTPR